MTGVHKTALATTFLIAVLAGWYAVPEAQGPPQPPPGQERRRYVVEFDQVGPGAAAAVRTAGGDVVHEFPQFGMAAAWLPEAALAALRNNPNVPEHRRGPAAVPVRRNGPVQESRWCRPIRSTNPRRGSPIARFALSIPDTRSVTPTCLQLRPGWTTPNAGAWSVDRMRSRHPCGRNDRRDRER